MRICAFCLSFVRGPLTYYLRPPYAIGQAIICLPCGFFLSFFFFLLFLA